MRYYNAEGFRGVPYNGLSGPLGIDLHELLGIDEAQLKEVAMGAVFLGTGMIVSFMSTVFGLRKGWPVTIAGMSGMGIGGYMLYKGLKGEESDVKIRQWLNPKAAQQIVTEANPEMWGYVRKFDRGETLTSHERQRLEFWYASSTARKSSYPLALKVSQILGKPLPEMMR